MDSREVGVLEEGDEVRLRRLLEGHDGGGLEAEVSLFGSMSAKSKGKEQTTRHTLKS